MSDLLTRHRFDVDDFHRMVEAGILHENDRTELVEGDAVCMSPIGSRHAWCVNHLAKLFWQRLEPQSLVSIQNPVRLSRHSEPQPDLAILRPRPDGYRSALPEPGDTLLIIEVSDSTLRYDRDIKLKLYAKTGVPEVWIVDLAGERVLTFAELAAEVYETTASHQRGSAIAPAALPNATFMVDEILG